MQAKSACNLFSSASKLLGFHIQKCAIQSEGKTTRKACWLYLKETVSALFEAGSRDVDFPRLTQKFSAGHRAPQPNHSFLTSLVSRDGSQAS